MEIVIEKDTYGWKFQIRLDLREDYYLLAGIRNNSTEEKKKILNAFLGKHKEIKKHYFTGEKLIFEGSYIKEDYQIKYLLDIHNSIIKMVKDAIDKYEDFKKKVDAVSG